MVSPYMRPSGFQSKEFAGEKLVTMIGDSNSFKHFSSFETDGGISSQSNDMYNKFALKKNRALSKKKRLNPFENIDTQGAFQCQLSSVFMLEDVLKEQKTKQAKHLAEMTEATEKHDKVEKQID